MADFSLVFLYKCIKFDQIFELFIKNHPRKVFEYIRHTKTCSFKAFVEWRKVSIKKIMMENRVSFL